VTAQWQRQVVLVLGGARSGKSRYAQRLAEITFRHPLYLATAEIRDEEMADRVRKHRKKRGPRWRCVEEPLDIASVLRRPPRGCDGILVDCATLWLSNVLLKEGARAVRSRQRALRQTLRQRGCDVILVSNEVGMGIVPEHPLGRQFRDLQGWLNQDLAATADTVVLVVAGLPMILKGQAPFSRVSRLS
jgi:adenosylcobinamide kinase / adenosylcobinamide-phosphate guanylyltransferase